MTPVHAFAGKRVAVFGLGGLPTATRRGLVVAFSTSVAMIMGTNLIYPLLPTLLAQFHLDADA